MSLTDLTFPRETVFLVTGGAGFIGSHLVEGILSLGCRVRVLDNLSTGFRANLAPFEGNPNFSFTEGDIRDLPTVLTLCEGVDYILHEAAWGSVPRSLKMPLEYAANNTVGTLNIFEAAKRCGVRRVVFASSSSVYGDDPTLPKTEGREGQPLSPYALTKRETELWASLYCRIFGLDAIALRYFNVFGPRQNPEGAYAAVIPKFIAAALGGVRPVIHGDGRQSRDFTYVDNVVEANLLACLAPPGGAGAVLNIAGGQTHTLIDLWEEIAKQTGCTLTPLHDEPRKGDILHSHADLTAAREMIGYTPSVSFREGLSRTIRRYREERAR